MPCFFRILFLCFLGLAVSGQESIQFQYLNLHDTTPELHLPVAVPVSFNDLGDVSSSILKAETWLRTNVLAHFPSTKITTILVGESALFCQKNQEHNLGLLLPSMKNIHHSLTRWGLEKDIKVSTFLVPRCFKDEKIVKTMLDFLQITNSSYSVHPPPSFSAESSNLLSSNRDLMKKIGSFEFNKINVIVSTPSQGKRMNRKLSVMGSKLIDPFPARPTPLPEIPDIHSSIGFSMPAHVTKNPPSPHSHTSSPPPLSFLVDSPPPQPFPTAPGPDLPPAFVPASPPFGFSLPPPSPTAPEPDLSPAFVPASPPFAFSPLPCNPADSGMAPAPEMGIVQKLWCVAKPSVPEETLQEAMGYACGEGGADCQEIMPNGSCFNPDTSVAHASYAFNSYWQKNKRNGGTCSFGGTAMIINSDPSFLHCRFVLS